MKEKKIDLKRYIAIVAIILAAPIAILLVGIYQTANALSSFGDIYD